MDKHYKKKESVNGYSITKKLGQGRYGIVYLAINENNEKVIIKQLKKEMLEETRKKLFYEKKTLDTLSNYDNFPKFISKFEDGDREGYILEYIEGTVLEDLIYKRGYEFSKEEIYQIAAKVLDIMEILHENNIVHRDIRTPNVIMRENKELVLIDFGLARFIDENHLKDVDYWYLGDFLIHLYYSSYVENDEEEKPWYEELNLKPEEEVFLKKLMGIEEAYKSIEEIREDLKKIKDSN
ncbi:serine/threonine protein kinase [Clostridium sp. B9]|uniref:serine/threonine protein kinase n=1 Tax=Clostridium sp. B9 TaxID=3423224 RepID=UPI003D2ED02F